MPHYETPLGTSYDPLGVSGAWNRMSVDSYQGAHSAAAIRPHTAGEDYQVPHARVDVFMGLALLRHLGDRFITSAATSTNSEDEALQRKRSHGAFLLSLLPTDIQDDLTYTAESMSDYEAHYHALRRSAHPISRWSVIKQLASEMREANRRIRYRLLEGPLEALSPLSVHKAARRIKRWWRLNRQGWGQRPPRFDRLRRQASASAHRLSDGWHSLVMWFNDPFGARRLPRLAPIRYYPAPSLRNQRPLTVRPLAANYQPVKRTTMPTLGTTFASYPFHHRAPRARYITPAPAQHERGLRYQRLLVTDSRGNFAVHVLSGSTDAIRARIHQWHSANIRALPMDDGPMSTYNARSNETYTAV